MARIDDYKQARQIAADSLKNQDLAAIMERAGYEGDDEFEAEANIVFDRQVGNMLSAEDIAWMAGMVEYRSMAFSR